MLNQQQAHQQAAAQQAQQQAAAQQAAAQQAAAQQAAYSQQALAQQAAPQRDPFVASQGVPVAASPQPSTPYHSKGAVPRSPVCLEWMHHLPQHVAHLLLCWVAGEVGGDRCIKCVWSTDSTATFGLAPQIRAWCAGRSCGTGTWRRAATRWAASRASSAWRALAEHARCARRPPRGCCTRAS